MRSGEEVLPKVKMFCWIMPSKIMKENIFKMMILKITGRYFANSRWWWLEKRGRFERDKVRHWLIFFLSCFFFFSQFRVIFFVVPPLWSNQARLLKHSRCTVKYPEVSCPVLRLFESESMKLLDFFRFPPQPAVHHFWTLRSSVKTNSLPMKIGWAHHFSGAMLVLGNAACFYFML